MTTTTTKLPIFPERYDEQKEIAFQLINALHEAPNQELRGRTPSAGWERINKFLAADSYLKSLEISAQETLLGAERFKEEVAHELSIFERRANRNPEIIHAFEGKVDREIIYREIANLIFDAFASNPLTIATTPQTQRAAVSSVKQTTNTLIQLPPEPEHEPPTIIKKSEIIIDPVTITIKNNDEFSGKLRSSAELESEIKLERLLGLAENFSNHQLNKFNDHVELAELLFEVSSNPEIAEFANLVKEHLGKNGEQHLTEIGNITRACIKLNQGKEISFQGLADTLERIRNLEGYGLNFENRPLKHLTDAGILTSSSKEKLLLNHDLIKSADPVTLRIATRMSETFLINYQNLKDLNEIVTDFKQSEKSDDWIEKRLSEPLKMGPAKISHLKNVAILAKLDVNIEPLLLKNAEGEEVIRMAAHGELDVVSQKDSHYKKLLQTGIDSSLRVLRDAKPEHKSAIINATKAIRDAGRYNLFDIQDTLITFASNSKCSNLDRNLIDLAKALANLSHGGCSLDKLKQIAEMAPKQYTEHGDEKTIQFLLNLSDLKDHGTRGIENLVDSGLKVLIRRAEGDETQHFAGFPVEASTAIHLKDAGYEICALSSSISSNYQYDIIAKDPTGHLLGIEVKRTLDTLISKNYKSNLSQTENIVNTQLYKHALSAKIDGITPVVAILYRHEDSWARTPALHLLDSIKKQLGVKPLVMNRMDGRVINL